MSFENNGRELNNCLISGKHVAYYYLRTFYVLFQILKHIGLRRNNIFTFYHNVDKLNLAVMFNNSSAQRGCCQPNNDNLQICIVWQLFRSTALLLNKTRRFNFKYRIRRESEREPPWPTS
jgi:hypothetical protein